MFWFLFIVSMGVLGRLSGTGFGKKRGLGWLPELLFAVPFGVALGWVWMLLGGHFLASLFATAIGVGISYAGMQSATWMFLRWESHDDPNTERTSTMKPVIDFIAKFWGYKLGDEGYSWIAAGVKGFVVGLPVGGILTAVLWPLGYEAGSHVKERFQKVGLDPAVVSEFLSAAGGGFAIFAFVKVAGLIAGF